MKPMRYPSRNGRQFCAYTAVFAGLALCCAGLGLEGFCFAGRAEAWTMADLNPWKQVKESRIFSLTRANPIGVRIMVVPVIDDPTNSIIVTRLANEFSNSMRSFANEVWQLTDLPDNPLKEGFYTALPAILADYRLKNHLSMELLKQMIPDFECDYIALFEVTQYDRFWVDEDLQHRVGVRAVFYDYQNGDPKIEKFHQGARGRRLEEGAFSEAERFAIKGLVEDLEKPLRKAVKEREEELKRRYEEVQALAGRVGQKELAIHQYDLALMKAEIKKNQDMTRQMQEELQKQLKEKDYWQKQAIEKEELLKQKEEDGKPAPTGSQKPVTYRSGSPSAMPPLMPRTQAGPVSAMPKTTTAMPPHTSMRPSVAAQPVYTVPSPPRKVSNGDTFNWSASEAPDKPSVLPAGEDPWASAGWEYADNP